MKKQLTTATLLLAAAAAAQGAYVIEQLNTNATFGNAATGQSFKPSVGMVDDPGESTTTIDLTSFSLWANGGTAAGTPLSRTVDTTYLLIYDANPSGAANLVGSSTNFLDLNPFPGTGFQMTWTFNNLTLDYDTTYFAVFSSSNTGTDANDIGVGLQVDNTNPYSGGTGLTNNFTVATTQDAKFSATFANPIPEPSATLLGGLGMLALLRRRRA
ncbi:MAG: PEP-CTERM sorting domain-containing protein [Luteolibacter sp.]